MWGVVLTRVFARSSRFEQGCNRCTDIECMSGPAEYTDRHFLKRLLRARGEFDFDFAFPIPVELCFLFHRVVGGPKYLWTRLGSFRSRARNGRIEYCLDERRGREGIRKSSLFRFFFFCEISWLKISVFWNLEEQNSLRSWWFIWIYEFVWVYLHSIGNCSRNLFSKNIGKRYW